MLPLIGRGGAPVDLAAPARPYPVVVGARSPRRRGRGVLFRPLPYLGHGRVVEVELSCAGTRRRQRRQIPRQRLETGGRSEIVESDMARVGALRSHVVAVPPPPFAP